MNSTALARTSRPCVRSTARRASSGNTEASPEPARYIVSASAICAVRRAPSPHHASICVAAHSGGRSSWHVVQAFGTPYATVISGTGGSKV